MDATVRDEARVMLWALSIAQQVHDAAAPMLAVVHLLKNAGPETTRVWDHFVDLHRAADELIATCDAQGGTPLFACSQEDSEAHVLRVLDEVLKVRDIVRSKMWVDTGHTFHPQSMTSTMYTTYASVPGEVPAPIMENLPAKAEILTKAEALGLDGRSVDALIIDLQQAMRFVDRDIFGWASFDFLELVLGEEDLETPIEDAWDAVIAVRTERVRRLNLANQQQRFDAAVLLDLADQECAIVLQALVPRERQLDVERRLWRRANPSIAGQTDARRSAATAKGERALRGITPSLLEWERAGQRTIGLSHAPGMIDLNLLDEDKVRVSHAERAVRAAMIEW